MKNSKIFSLSKLMLLLVLSLCLMLAVVSCGDSEDDGEEGTTTTTKPDGVACVHTYNEGTVLVEATCTNGGSILKTCTKCGFESTVTTAKLAHNYEAKTVNATCTENGSVTYTCKSCKDSYSDVTAPAKGHNLAGVSWTAKEELISGCDWMHIETANCTDCGEASEHITYYTKHNFSVSITTQATCVTEGVKTYSCSSCSATETESFTDANAHTWGEGVVSPTNANIMNYTCANEGCTGSKSVFSAKDQVSASVPAEALQSAGAVELQNATVKMDQSTLDQFKGNDITISAETVGGGDISDILEKMDAAEKEKLNSTTVFDFTLNQGGSAISQFNGKVTVTVPYTLANGEDPDNIAVWYIKEDGTLDALEATYTYIGEQGYAMFETNHFSYYSVVRMSAEERCALYGHKYNTEVVKPACGKEGYSIDTCKYCKKVEPRRDFTAALSHNYETSIVAPTCDAKGYTLNKCSICKDSFNSNYVDQLTHNYEKTVIAPTCKSSGYTLNKCTLCSDTYKENELGIIDHKYSGGKCTMCGKAQDSAGNSFLTMVDSLANAESFLLEASNLIFTGLVDGTEVKYSLSELKAYVKVTADGLLEGEGISNVSVTYKRDKDEETMTSTGKLLLKDGKIYVYTNSADIMMGGISSEGYYENYYPQWEGGPIYNYGSSSSTNSTVTYPTDVTYDLFAVVDQAKLIDMVMDEMDMTMSDEMTEMIEKAKKDLLGIWNSVLGAKNSPIEATIERLVDLIFTKKEVNGGYTYTLNPTFTKVVLESFKTETLDKIFNNMFGKDAYANAIDFANRALDMTVSALKAEVEGELAKSGIIAATIYALLEEYSQGQFNVDQMLESYKDMKLYELLNGMTNNQEGTVDSYKEFISQLDQMMTTTKPLDLFEQNVGEYDESYDEMLDEIIDIIDEIKISFSTTKDGEFISYSISFNDFLFDEEIRGDQYKFTAVGTFTFSINTGAITGDHDQLIKDTNSLENAINPSENVYTDDFAIIIHNGVKYFIRYNQFSSINGGNSGNVVIKPVPGEKYVASAYASDLDYIYDLIYGDGLNFSVTEELGSESYNGMTCTKVKASITNFYVIENGTYTYGAHSCEGWIHVGALATRYCPSYVQSGFPPATATLWINEEGKVVGMDVENLDSCYYTSSEVEFYYAPATKEYKEEPSHNFVLTKDVRPNGCEYGIRYFVCDVCGATYDYSYGQGHKWQQVATLNNGSVTCADGVTITRKCTRDGCGKVDDSYSWTTNDHYTVRCTERFTGTTPCGDIIAVYESCACGAYGNFIGTISDHSIQGYEYEDSYYDEDGHYHKSDEWKVFRCSVEGCGFSYKFRSKSDYTYEPNNPEGTCWYSYFEEAIIYNKTYHFDRETYQSHDTYGESSYNYDGSIETVIYRCSMCKNILSEYRYEKTFYGSGEYDYTWREIYYKDYESDYGWNRVWNGCSYVNTYFDGTTDSGISHDTHYVCEIPTSCSQYGYYYYACYFCNYVSDIRYESPYDYYWYDGMNNSHDWYYDYDKDTYYCYRCGTESSYGASGFITLEDMTDTGYFKVGYYNGLILDITDIDIIFNYQLDGSGDMLDNSAAYYENKDTTPYEYYLDRYDNRNSGIITVNMDMLEDAIANHGNVETVSVVFTLLLDSQVNEGESFVQQFAMTFTLDELAYLN